MSDLIYGRVSVMMMIDEAMSELARAKAVLECVGKGSEYVQQARFERFTRSIDGVSGELLKVGMSIEEELEEERK